MWLACRAYYACVVRVFIKHTISLYISSFTPLYVYTSIRPIIFSHLPRFAILGTLKRPRPYSSSRSNRRHAPSDAVVEPRSMSLTVSVVNIDLFMIFAVFDPSPLTVCINCSFLHLYENMTRLTTLVA